MNNQVKQLAELINKKQDKPIPKSWERFIDYYIETGSITEAALKSFKVKDKKSASARGGYVMRLLGISNEVQAALAKVGITRQWRFDKLKRNIEIGSDKALEMAMKVGNDFPREEKDITSGGKPIAILGGQSVSGDYSHKKDTSAQEKN